jgi:hypothetical protein
MKIIGCKLFQCYLTFIFLCACFCACNKSAEEQNQLVRGSLYKQLRLKTPTADSIKIGEIEAFEENKFKKYAVKKEIIANNVDSAFHVTNTLDIELSQYIAPDSILKKAIRLNSVTATPETQLGFFPEVTVAKDMAHSATNPMGISYFGKLQGLKHDYVCNLIEDKSGNLWIGSRGGGVSKYDGKYLTHFHEKDGFLSNDIWALMEDRKGNIWIGSNGDGIVCYEGNQENKLCNSKQCKHNLSKPEDMAAHQRKTSHAFTIFNEKSGLHDNMIRKFYEDNKGRIWIATSNGLSVYDGKTFTSILSDFFPHGEIIFSITQDHEGYMWILAGRASVVRLDYDRMQHPCMTQTCKHHLDNKNDLNEHLKERSKSFTCFQLSQKKNHDASCCFDVMVDYQKNIWIASDFGLVKMNQNYVKNPCFYQTCKHNLLQQKDYSEHCKQLSVPFSLYTEEQGLSAKYLIGVTEDSNHNIWIATYGGGVNRFDGKAFYHITTKEGLSTNETFIVLQDRTGNIWIGGRKGGVNKFNDANFRHYLSQNDVKLGVLNIYQDDSARIWLGTESGKLTYYKNNIFFSCKPSGFKNERSINSITVDKAGNIWEAIWGGGIRKFDGEKFLVIDKLLGIEDPLVNSVIKDYSDNIWISTWNKGVIRFDGKSMISWTPKEGLSDFRLTSLAIDHEGNIWVGMFDGSISILKPTMPNHPCNKKLCNHNLFIASELQEHQKNSSYTIKVLPNPHEHVHNVNAILPDRAGKVWIGTLGKGIRYIDGNREIEFCAANGLISDFVTALCEDENGDIWIGTRYGISRLYRDKFEQYLKNPAMSEMAKGLFQNFSFADGFLGMSCNKNALFARADNEIWAGCDDRLTIIKKDAMKKQSIVPDVKITALNLFNDETDWIQLSNNIKAALQQKNGTIIKDVFFDKLHRWENIPEQPSFAFNNNFVTFRYIAPNIDMAHRIRYRYMLSGLDRNWNTATDKTEANYGNLSPGNYTFRIYAINTDGIAGKETSYPFTIRPPWWKTWWAYTSYMLMVIGASIFYIRWRERALRARQKELEIKVDEATKEIRSQKAVVEKEKSRSEELLRNILPEEVAEELKLKGKAEAKQIEQVTVLFTDFKGFTEISEKLSPKELVNEIHECFSAFDRIMLKHGVEKIKTIGDAYMAAGGIPKPTKTHAIDVVNAALELQHFMNDRNKVKQKNNELFFEIRIGIHTGPVVAGIVGVKKFAYDIWGDTVNTASRMESSGEAGKVNISGATYACVKNLFKCTYRGKIKAKGKGEIDMYFVD